MEECITHPNMIVHNKFLITEYTDDENLPREVLIRLMPKIEAIFDHYNGKINYIPTDKNKAEGTITSLSWGSVPMAITMLMNLILYVKVPIVYSELKCSKSFF